MRKTNKFVSTSFIQSVPRYTLTLFTDVYLNGSGGTAKLVGECSLYRLVVALSVAFYHPVHARLVGFLIV